MVADNVSTATASSVEKCVVDVSKTTKRPFWKRPIVLGVICASLIVVAIVLGTAIPLSLRSRSDGDGSDGSSSAAASSIPTSNGTASVPTNSSAPLYVNQTFDLALGYNVSASNANASTHFYTLDLANTASEAIAGLVGAGHTVACYFSAGSVESYRTDASDVPASAVGKTMKGWEDERWLDTRADGVRAVMRRRIELAAAKGCHGIDADNIDGYDNDTGFALSRDDGVAYVRWLAAEAHARGLLFGLKNGGAIVPDVLDVSAWDIQEECVRTDECQLYKPFVDAGKPVFHVEYTDSDKATTVDADELQKACAAGGVAGFSTVVKHMQLDSWAVACQ